MKGAMHCASTGWDSIHLKDLPVYNLLRMDFRMPVQCMILLFSLSFEIDK